jgi:hypothetical protein
MRDSKVKLSKIFAQDGISSQTNSQRDKYSHFASQHRKSSHRKGKEVGEHNKNTNRLGDPHRAGVDPP